MKYEIIGRAHDDKPIAGGPAMDLRKARAIARGIARQHRPGATVVIFKYGVPVFAYRVERRNTDTAYDRVVKPVALDATGLAWADAQGGQA